jgi:membrane-associated phospholipid phosphatase
MRAASVTCCLLWSSSTRAQTDEIQADHAEIAAHGGDQRAVQAAADDTEDPHCFMLYKTALFAAVVAVTGFIQSAPARADGLGPTDFFHDAGLYFTAPLRWDGEDWLYFGGTLAAIGAAHTLDSPVRDYFAGKHPILDGQDPNSTRDALPAAALFAGTWLLSTAMGDQSGKGESYTMMEAGIFSAITGEGLKFAAERARPNETLDANDWRVGGASFPSLHASAAFAIGTVFAESGDDEYRWLRRFIGYGTAAATGYLRLHDNAHWLSDVVAGAAVGVATAHFSINRRLERVQHLEGLNLSVAPIPGDGLELNFSLPMN